jgi:hypothetical protein
MAIFSRSVRAVDPSVSAEQAQLYAEYIIRVATWEVEIANATCMATLAAHFPSIKAKVLETVKFSVPSVYIGRCGGSSTRLYYLTLLCSLLNYV